ncbi:MAG TPA: VOC family protein, partial [Bryobacteraceae bacterium]
MISNLSVPANTILPHIVYRDVAAASAWLTRAFGFVEHYRYGGEAPDGAQMHLGNAWVMLRKARAGEMTPADGGFATQSLTIFVDDVEAHFETAKSSGATVVEDPHETMYGEFQYAAVDLDGHHWLFSRH